MDDASSYDQYQKSVKHFIQLSVKPATDSQTPVNLHGSYQVLGEKFINSE
jgi:hypothetical protein